jgi:hypothetical protein
MQRSGDWNQKNRELWEETQRLGGNKYREIYQQLIKRMKHKRFVYTNKEKSYHLKVNTDGYVVAVPVDEEKKCTCGDTETQHYENTDKCVVCGCKEFEERVDQPGFEGTWEALENITIKPR